MTHKFNRLKAENITINEIYIESINPIVDPDRLLSTDSDNQLKSVSTLSSWLTSGDSSVIIADGGNGKADLRVLAGSTTFPYIDIQSSGTLDFYDEDLDEKIRLKGTTHTIGVSTTDQSMLMNVPTLYNFNVSSTPKMSLTLTGLNVDVINELTSTSGVTIDGVLIKDNDITLDGNSLTENHTYITSAGCITVPTITNNGNGTVGVGSFICYLRDSNNDVSSLKQYTVSGVDPVTLVDNSINYVYCDVNGGTPLILSTTGSTPLNRGTDQIELYKIYRSGTDLHITEHFHIVGSHNKYLNKFLLSLTIILSAGKRSEVI